MNATHFKLFKGLRSKRTSPYRNLKRETHRRRPVPIVGRLMYGFCAGFQIFSTLFNNFTRISSDIKGIS